MRIIFRIMLLFRTLQGTLWFGDETRLPKHVGQARPNAPHGTGWNLLSNQWATLRKKRCLSSNFFPGGFLVAALPSK